MIIYTNSGNPLGLELLLFAKFAKREVSVEKINANDKDFLIIPTAQVVDGVRLFSTNAVALYLFGDETNNSNERNEWLEWTASKLMPVLALNTKSNKNRSCPTVKAIVSNQLNKIEQQLQDKPFILGTTLTSVDLAIWSLLATEDVLSGVQNVDKLLKWFNAIKVLPEVQQAVQEFPLKELSFSAVLQGNRYSDVTTQLPISPTVESNKPAVVDDITSEELQAARKHFVHVPLVTRKEERTVLPKAGERNVLITSALPYVNNVPHLGNIIGCVLSADIFARFCRMSGYNTLYVCGTDEYGTATENKALAENLTPKEICDKYFQLHNNIYRWLFIGFDYFGRTTTKEQTEIVQSAFKDLYDNGYILKESVDQLLCQKCDRFLADRFVEGTCHHVGCGYEDARGDQCDKCGKLINATELIKPRCNVCRSPPVIRSSEQLFIDLPKIEPELRKWLDSVDNEWTHNARVITRAWLREGLKPRCITRDLKWGVPVPLAGFEKKVFYVWFDAPFGYVSMTKKYTKEYQQWWQPAANVKVEHFEFMAKDNVPFHGIMWPAILLAINKGHTMVKHVMATEYLNYEDGKFSKSRGIGVFGNDAQDTGIAADVWRFYLASARPESQDSSFSWNDLETRNNSELLNNLGNFVNRALVFCEKNFDGVIPTMKLNDLDLDLLAHINRELRGYLQSMERAKMRDAIRHLFSISRLGNGYMQAEQPWVLLKGDEVMKSRAGTIIGICCNISALLANLMFPFMPASARNLYAQLNMQQGQLNSPYVSISLPTRHQIGKPMPLFQKLEPAFIEQLKGKYGGSQATNESVAKPQQEVSSASVAELELAVQKQGEKLRLLKTTTKDKSVIQPEVTILLDLKQRLAEAQKLQETAMPAAAVDVKELEAAIQKQGDKLRQLKSETKDKSLWQPEVNILIELKNKLAAATGGNNRANICHQQFIAKKQKEINLKFSL